MKFWLRAAADLEAAMCLRGAFELGQKIETVEAIYLKLGGPVGGKESASNLPRANFMDVVEDHFRGLVELLNQFRDPATPHPPRPFPKFMKRWHNAYDHLAASRNGRVAARPKGAARNGILLRYPHGDARQAAPGLKSKPVRLGFCKRRIWQDTCAREPGYPASFARRRALEYPPLDLTEAAAANMAERVFNSRRLDMAPR
jgi:hypothetical protein